MNDNEELMRLYKERKELVLKRYQEMNKDLAKLEEWYKKEYGDDSLTMTILAERTELILEHHEASGGYNSETIQWYKDTFKDDIDIGDAETIVEMALDACSLPLNASTQTIINEVAKRNLAPSEVMAHYMKSKEDSKGCALTLLLMITATSLTSLLFL